MSKLRGAQLSLLLKPENKQTMKICQTRTICSCRGDHKDSSWLKGPFYGTEHIHTQYL